MPHERDLPNVAAGFALRRTPPPGATCSAPFRESRPTHGVTSCLAATPSRQQEAPPRPISWLSKDACDQAPPDPALLLAGSELGEGVTVSPALPPGVGARHESRVVNLFPRDAC